MGKTSIEWVRGDDGSAGYTINPIRARNRETGAVGHFCEKVSPGCKNCYASAWNERVRPQPNGRPSIGTGLAFVVFWCDMTDLFGEWVPDEWIVRCLAVMALTPQHTHILVTKRAERMRDYMRDRGRHHDVTMSMQDQEHGVAALIPANGRSYPRWPNEWPLANVWLGTSVENQHFADERIPLLLQTPAAVRFISVEPLLGPLPELFLALRAYCPRCDCFLMGQSTDAPYFGVEPYHGRVDEYCGTVSTHLDWVIVGGESGVGARPCDRRWLYSIVEQCQAAGVPVFVKQLGAVSIIDGVTVAADCQAGPHLGARHLRRQLHADAEGSRDPAEDAGAGGPRRTRRADHGDHREGQGRGSNSKLAAVLHNRTRLPMVWRARICDTCGKPAGNPSCATCRGAPLPPRLQAGATPAPAEPESGGPPRERRDLDRQVLLIGGARATDPRLTTRDCADRLGVTSRFILGEILDGRLKAHVRQRQGLRALYRVSEVDFDAYVREHWPSALPVERSDGTGRR